MKTTDSGKPLQILLVEDSATDAALLQESILSSGVGGLCLKVAKSLHEAIDHLTSGPVDAVLLDLTLPDSSGLDTVQHIERARPDIPIVVLTGMDDERTGVEAVRMGAQDYLVKGRVDGRTIVRAVHYSIERMRAEAAIRRAKEEWERTFDSVPDLIAILDGQHRILRVNKAMAQRLGVTTEECTGKMCYKAVHGLDGPPDFCPHVRTLADGGEHMAEVHEPCLGGDFMVSTTPLEDERGQRIGSVHVARDITERKKAEEELRKLNRTLRALSDSSQAMMWARSESAYLEEVCKIVVEDCGHAMVWVGFSQDDEEKTVRPVAHAGFEQGYLETLRITWADTERGQGPTGTAIRTGKLCICRNMLTDPVFTPWREEATKRGYASSIVLPLIADGKAFGSLNIYSREPDPFSQDEVRLLAELAGDLSYGVSAIRVRQAHEQAEEAIRQREERYRGLVEMSPDALFVSRRNRIMLANPAALQLFGATHEEQIVGRSLPEMFHASCRAVMRKQIRALAGGKAAAEKSVSPTESRIVRLDGGLRDVEVAVAPFEDADGRAIQVVFHDVTERKRAEEALRETRDYLDNLFNYANAPIITWDPQFRITRFNRAFERLTGRLAKEVLGSDIGVLFPEESRQESLAHIRHTTSEGGRWDVIEIPILHRDGSVRTVLWNSANILAPDNKTVIATIAQGQDITERKGAEQALRDSEERLRLALEGGRLGRWEWDLRDDSSFWCERTYALLGVDAHVPATGSLFFKIVDRRDRESLRTLITQAWAVEDRLHAEFRVVRPDGVTLWLALAGKVMRDEQGQAVRMFAVLFDVTPRKRMEEQLRQLNEKLEEEVQAQTEELRETIGRLQDEAARRVTAEEQLRERSRMLESFFGHSITPLAFMDRQFNFIRVNEAYARAGGKDPEYFVGKNHFVLYPHEESRAIFEQVVRTRQPHEAFAQPFTYPEDPQHVVYRNWQLMPLLDDAGEVQFLVLNLEDVTERQRAFRELEQRARQLQQLALELSQAEDRERRRLAEILHDDLQQQLAAAKFHLGILSSRVKSVRTPQESDATWLEMTGQLDQILKDAIDKSRSLSHELNPAVLYQGDLGEAFEWLARHMQTKHGLVVHVETRQGVDSQSEAVKALLYKMAQEILFNVVKHASVKESRLRLQRRGGQLWLTIADQGRGFDPTSVGQSGGFGLMSIRERVELVGGRMKIRSVEGKGSVFVIAIPDARTRAAPSGGRRHTLPAASGAERGESAVRSGDRRLRVLLVDDHKVVREGLATMLSEQRDIEVIGQAGNGREAVDLAYKLQPDVVVMDVAMPVMAGDEATRQIRLHLPGTRIIALSMFEEAEMAEKMCRAGAKTYLLKTAPSEELLAAIRG